MAAILICQLIPVSDAGWVTDGGYVAGADECTILVWQSVETLFSTVQNQLYFIWLVHNFFTILFYHKFSSNS